MPNDKVENVENRIILMYLIDQQIDFLIYFKEWLSNIPHMDEFDKASGLACPRLSYVYLRMEREPETEPQIAGLQYASKRAS